MIKTLGPSTEHFDVIKYFSLFKVVSVFYAKSKYPKHWFLAWMDLFYLNFVLGFLVELSLNELHYDYNILKTKSLHSVSKHTVL